MPCVTNQVLGHIDVGSLVGSSDVVNKPNFCLEENDFEGSGDVFHIEEVPLVRPVSMESKFSASHQLVDKLGYQLFGVLMGAVDVIASSDYDRHAEGAVVRFCQEFRTSFCSSVWICRF